MHGHYKSTQLTYSNMHARHMVGASKNLVEVSYLSACTKQIRVFPFNVHFFKKVFVHANVNYSGLLYQQRLRRCGKRCTFRKLPLSLFSWTIPVIRVGLSGS